MMSKLRGLDEATFGPYDGATPRRTPLRNWATGLLLAASLATPFAIDGSVLAVAIAVVTGLPSLVLFGMLIERERQARITRRRAP